MTYLFAGASSSIAKATATLLQQEGHLVLGLSTKTDVGDYDKVYTVDRYESGQFPTIDWPIDGLVYFPGTINLKPFARMSAQDFMNDFQINALGAVAFVQHYLPKIKQSNAASVVFITIIGK
jgi:NADP-dependent 3-hydroxy acid dehydrogenase YdfG